MVAPTNIGTHILVATAAAMPGSRKRRAVTPPLLHRRLHDKKKIKITIAAVVLLICAIISVSNIVVSQKKLSAYNNKNYTTNISSGGSTSIVQETAHSKNNTGQQEGQITSTSPLEDEEERSTIHINKQNMKVTGAGVAGDTTNQYQQHEENVLSEPGSAITATPTKPKNIIILHVGPSKTGTSSIQCSLQTSPFLRMSNYEYIGRQMKECEPSTATHPVQIRKIPEIPPPTAMATKLVGSKKKNAAVHLKIRLKASIAENLSAIFSAEEFDMMPDKDEETWDLVEYALGPFGKHRVRVVVTYRHYHELLISAFHERIAKRDVWQDWARGAKISFPAWWARVKNDTAVTRNDTLMNLFTPGSKLIDAFEKHSYNVTVFDFHGNTDVHDRQNDKKVDDLVTRFICHLPNATAACNSYVEGLQLSAGEDVGTPVSRRNMKDYDEYDRIAKAAYDHGFVPKGLRRSVVVNAIQDHVEKTMGLQFVDLPLQCCSEDDMKYFVALSIEEGRAVWKDAFDDVGLEASFQAYKAKGSFCSVDVDILLKDDGWVSFFKKDMLTVMTDAAVVPKEVKPSGNDADDDVNPLQQNEILSLLIPPKPDFIPNQNVHKAIATSNGTTTTPLIYKGKSCNITSQVRLHVVNKRNNAANTSIVQQWTLETMDEHGNTKHVGGDEFYVTYHHNSFLYRDDTVPESSPDHPTATATVKDMGDGTYHLQFVSSPMATANHFLDKEKRESHARLIADLVANGNKVDTGGERKGGELKIHFVYSCGIGQMPPPTKDQWKNGGYTQTVYSVQLDRPPPISKFQPTCTHEHSAGNLSSLDEIILVGDSVMEQFAFHRGTSFRPHVHFTGNIGRPLNSNTWKSFSDRVTANVAHFNSLDVANSASDTTTSSTAPRSPALGVIVGSSTWDILADDLSQGSDFSNHRSSMRNLIQDIKMNHPNVTLLWKSPTAVHPHIVVSERTKWFGPVEKAVKRTRYMSESRSRVLYLVQKEICDELAVPFLDVYEAYALSGDWHFPTDGRHYRPELNRAVFTWLFGENEKSSGDNITIDYRYDGY